MNTLTVEKKVNSAGQPVKVEEIIRINLSALDADDKAGSLYIREARSGRLFLSRRGHGAEGAGDICALDESVTYQTRSPFFESLKHFADKACALLESSSSIKEEHKGQWVWFDDISGLDYAILNNWFESTYEEAVKACASRNNVTKVQVMSDGAYFIQPVEELEDEEINDILTKYDK